MTTDNLECPLYCGADRIDFSSMRVTEPSRRIFMSSAMTTWANFGLTRFGYKTMAASHELKSLALKSS
jgi:hypothetical protein